MHQPNQNRHVPVLFLKATTKKQVWVPQYTRSDGRTVKGHMAMVHVTDDHDDKKVLTGQGSYSQKNAHKKLQKHDWYHQLPDDHKVPVLMEHATKLQEADSQKAVLAVFKKKIIAGGNPTPSEWKMFDGAPSDKKEAINNAAADAHKLQVLEEGYAKWKSTQPGTSPAEPETPAAAPEPEAKKLSPELQSLLDKAFKGQKPSDEEFAAFDELDSDDQEGIKARIHQAGHASMFFDAFEEYKDDGYGGSDEHDDYGNEFDIASLPNLSLKTLVVKGLKGEKPTDEEYAAFDAADDDIKSSIHEYIAENGSLVGFLNGYAKYKEAQLQDDKPAPTEEVKTEAETETPASIKDILDKIEAQKLPESNSNHKVVNGKLDVLASAIKTADHKAILSGAYGNNTYAKKIVKLANEALEALGQEHQVNLSQKKDSHPALADTPAAAASDTPAEAAPVVEAPAEVKPEGVHKVQTFTHTKKGHMVYAVQLPNKLDDADYKAVAAKAKQMGGMYSSFKGAGAIPGFHFKDPAAADAFAADLNGSVPAPAPATAPAPAIVPVAAAPADEPKTYSESNQSPKEGDTKPGADGTLVFKDGRWHKVDDGVKSPAELKALAKSVPIPKMTGKHSLKFKKVAEALKDAAEKYGAEEISKLITVSSTGTQVKISSVGVQDCKIKLPYSYNFIPLDHGMASAASFAKYGKDLLEVMKGTKGSGEVAAEPVKAPKVVGAKEIIKPTPTVPLKKEGKVSVLNGDSWVQTGEQKGSNPGGKFKDGNGVEWYCKFPGDPKVVKNELLAAKFYEMLGVAVPSLRLVKKDGKLGIASKWVDGLKVGTADDIAKAAGAHDAFVFDAWLGNWDVVGLDNDNIMLGKKGAVRVDVGGSLLYRAMGGEKGAAFCDTVPELDTLKDAKVNNKSAAVFGNISDEAVKAGAEKLAKMRNGQIEAMVGLFAPGSDEEKKALANKLIARRKYILDKFGIKDPWNVEPLDESALTVNHADLPQKIDFSNYKGTGKGLSSKEHINKQNSIDDAALIDFAEKGNLTALKNYQYEAFDKETGKSLGKKPITDHPSKDIKEHWAYLIDLLDTIAHPSIKGLDMPPLGHGDISEVAEAAGFIKFGERVSTIPADKRLGFWMKLAHAGDDYMDLIPKETQWVSPAVKSASKKAWSKVTGATKAFISAVQDSGWINHIYSKGEKTVSCSDSHGNKYSGGIGAITADCYNDAAELAEGTKVTRWMQMPTTMIAQLMEEKPGLIFQNTDSMCTSMDPDWSKSSKFGSDACVNIVYAKGAKALNSFASGRFNKEEEITTLAGARFMLIKASKGNASNSNGLTLDLLMLPPHEGFVADIQNYAKMEKSFVLFTKGGYKGGL